jgi:hypothetical protein
MKRGKMIETGDEEFDAIYVCTSGPYRGHADMVVEVRLDRHEELDRVPSEFVHLTVCQTLMLARDLVNAAGEAMLWAASGPRGS